MPQSEQSGSAFPGFQKPNYTMVPDELFDELLADLSGSELKALLYIVRRTFGFKRDSDTISINQMIEGITTRDGRVLDHGTGLARSTLVKALKSLEAKNIIISEKRSSPDQGFEATNYRLNIVGSDPGSADDDVTPDTPPSSKIELALSENRIPPSSIFELALVRKSNPQHTVKQQTDNNSVVVLLQERGISKTIAGRLAAKYSEDRIRSKVELLDYLLEINSPLVGRNPAGYLRKAIEEDYQPPAGFMTRAERKAEAERQAEEEGRIEAAIEEHQSRTDIVSQALEKHGTTDKVRQIWVEAQRELSNTMAGGTYATYLQNAVLLSLNDGEALLGMPNRYAKEWVENRLANSVCRVLEGVVGEPVHLRAVVLVPDSAG